MSLLQLRKYKYKVGVVLVIAALLIYKFRFLSLPYFWDEAWPYAVGVHNLYDNGLSLVPGAISTFVARGHPLMFHFLAAAWMKIFGATLLSGHSFAMFISVLLIISIFLFCKNFFSERVGFIACLLFSCQPIFIAQSAFLMPEVLMALLAMLCFYTFFGGKKAWFVIFGTAMLLTKESGGVFFVALFLYECSIFVTVPQKDWKGLFKKLSLVCLPVAIASVNFIIQKIKFGWFLYPFYIDYISSSPKPFAAKLATVAAYTFVYDGRNGFSVFIILSLFAMFIFKKLRMKEKERSVLFALSLFVVLYLIFSTVNYYIPRYLMCVFPPMYIIGALLIDRVFSKFKSVLALIILGLVITSVFFYMQPKTYGDIDYSPSVVTDWQMVKFCEDQNLYDNYIFTTTLLRGDLSEPYEGYLSGRKFEHTQWELNNQTEYCIFSADENDSALFDKIKKEKRLVLLKRFEQKYAWCEVYKVIN